MSAPQLAVLQVASEGPAAHQDGTYVLLQAATQLGPSSVNPVVRAVVTSAIWVAKLPSGCQREPVPQRLNLSGGQRC